MGRTKAERLVAIPIVLPKSLYLTLKQHADKQQSTIADLICAVINDYLGLHDPDEVNQEQALALIKDALSHKDAIAEAIAQAVKDYIDRDLTVAPNRI